jgi:hypothetical protein
MGTAKKTSSHQKNIKKHAKQKNKPLVTVSTLGKNKVFAKKCGKHQKTTHLTKKHTKNQLNNKQKHIYAPITHVFTKIKTNTPTKTTPLPTIS